MRKIFIDCGFYSGEAINSFKKTPEYANDFCYYAFDPMLKLDAVSQKWPNITFYKKAAWSSNGTLDFYTSHRIRGKANGVFHNKRAGRENIFKVESIDFSDWLKQTCKEEDFVILKMDIEGSEYEIVPKLIQDGTINLIDIFYLEWHSNRVGDVKGNKCQEIMSNLKKIDGLIIRKSIERYLRHLRRAGKI